MQLYLEMTELTLAMEMSIKESQAKAKSKLVFDS